MAVQVDTFNYTQNTWDFGPNMTVPRFAFSLVRASDALYAIGGGLGCRQHVERLSLATNTWRVCAALQHGRNDAAACAFRDQIYVFGGVNDVSLGVSCKVVAATEVYDVVSDAWRTLAFEHPFWGSSAVAVGGLIYSEWTEGGL